MRLLLALLLACALPAQAQLWSGIVDPTRAIDWSTSAGVPGGIPTDWPDCTSAACNTLFAGTVTTTQVNLAIAGAPNNTVVRVPAGTWTGLGRINFGRSNVILRGAGANQTKLVFSSTGSGCGGGVFSCTMQVTNSGMWSGGPENTTTFLGAGNPPSSGTYTKGATQILVGSTAGMAVGRWLILDQLSDTADTGNIYICSDGPAADCSSEGAGGGGGRGDARAYLQFVRITNVGGGNVVTIDRPIYMPNWTSGRSPGIWWTNSPVSRVGIEDLTVDARGTSAGIAIMFGNAHESWVNGVSVLKANGGRDGISMHYSSGIEIRDSYILGTPGGNLSYSVETWMSGNIKVENNIMHQGVSGILVGAGSGNVFGYNFFVDQVSSNASWLFPATMEHQPGVLMTLYEGNDAWSMMQDAIHGSHALNTFFRNRSRGSDDTSSEFGSQSSQTVPLLVASYSRYTNIIGNVLGRGGYHNNYQANSNGSSSNCNTSIYNLGWGSTGCSNGTVNADTLAITSAMRWGNYDVVSGTVRWESSEVPSGISPYGNAVPGSQTLPASFYLAARPDAWWATPWGTPAWPPIGPDVSGGNISEGSGGEAGLDGHAYRIPARLCFENTSQTAGVLNFNRASCYQSAVSLPTAPVNFRRTN